MRSSHHYFPEKKENRKEIHHSPPLPLVCLLSFTLCLRTTSPLPYAKETAPVATFSPHISLFSNFLSMLTKLRLWVWMMSEKPVPILWKALGTQKNEEKTYLSRYGWPWRTILRYRSANITGKSAPHSFLDCWHCLHHCCCLLSGRGPRGEAVIQLTYAWLGCAAKWGKMSKLPRSVFEAEIKKAVQEVFPEKGVPDPLGMVFKFWDRVAWYVR